MTTKADFNADEWQRITEGPALAGMVVIAAQKGGTIRESVQMAKAYTEAREHHGDSDLIGELVATPPQLESKEFNSAEELRTEGLQRIRDSVAMLESKATPEEVDAYRAFSITVAERAAEAHKSGGFLGIGGERVSADESQALDQVAEALGTTRTQ